MEPARHLLYLSCQKNDLFTLCTRCRLPTLFLDIYWTSESNNFFLPLRLTVNKSVPLAFSGVQYL